MLFSITETADAESQLVNREFYLQPVVDVAQALLGKLVVRTLTCGERLAGIIVETEAYRGDDPACHGFGGQTIRNRSLFGQAGHTYVYQTYGIHMMLNLVCGPVGSAEGVLVRALEPVRGTSTMQRLRDTVDLKSLTNGPGKLGQALGLHVMADDGIDVTLSNSPIQVYSCEHDPFDMVTSTRIGITRGVATPWRFYVSGNPFVSKK